MNQIVPSADVMQQAREHAPEIKPLHFIQCLDLTGTLVWINPAAIISIEITKINRHRVKTAKKDIDGAELWVAWVLTSARQYQFRIEAFQEATKQFFPSA